MKNTTAQEQIGETIYNIAKLMKEKNRLLKEIKQLESEKIVLDKSEAHK